MKYNSKVDLYNWIMLVIFVVVLALPNFVFDFSWIYFGVMIAVDLVVITQTFTTNYTFGEEELEIRSGLFKFGVYYDRIICVKKVKNCFDGAYSTALKSIEINFGDKNAKKPYKLFISPAREYEFLLKLMARCNDVKKIEDKRK